MKWYRHIKIVYRNKFFRAIRWMLPHECQLIITDCGIEKRLALFPGQPWTAVKFKRIEIARIIDAIVFCVLISKDR
jgi:hypothetical protein